MRMVATTGSLVLSPNTSAPIVVAGVVEGVVAGQAIVKISSGMAAAWPELVKPGHSAERLFAKGMALEGLLDPESRRLDVQTPHQTVTEALERYRAGDTVLVRVTEVTTTTCTVELFPEATATISAEEVADASTDLRGLMTVSEVLPALIVVRDDDVNDWLLSIQEAADPDEAVPAPSILRGGPPWLIPPPDPVPNANPATVGIAPGLQVEDLQEEAPAAREPSVDEALRAENRQLATRVHTLSARVSKLDDERAQTRRELRKAVGRRARDGSSSVDDSNLFMSEQDQMNFEINLAWARTTLPSEKEDLPLKKWRYSPHFFDTVRSVAGISREKTIEVICHVLTGRDADLVSRELHQLRTGTGGADPPVTRDGGETCWRVSLQVKTPSARRLHYWQRADGSIELSSIRLHDEFQP